MIKQLLIFSVGVLSLIFSQESEVVLSIENVDEEAQTFDIFYSSSGPDEIYGFQFEISGVSINTISNLATFPGAIVSAGNRTILAFSMTGEVILANGVESLLLTVNYTLDGNSEEICLENIVFATQVENGSEYIPSSSEGCYSIIGDSHDCTGVEDGTAVCLEFTQVDPDAGSLSIAYNSLNPISGFQFNLSGLEILSVESALDVYFVESSGFILGFIQSTYLPPGESELVTINFTPGPEFETCISNTIVTGLGGVSYDINLPDCELVPEASTDCTGEYGGDAVMDECGNCEGVEFDCAEAGACSCSGCMDIDSCNFDESALVDDGSCWQTNDFCSCGDGEGAVADCNDVCNGTSILDECGDCNGNNYDLCDFDGDGTSNLEQWGYGAHSFIVDDIDNDQGGRLHLHFSASFHDSDTLSRSEVYTIERKDDDIWMVVQSFGAYGAEEYNVEVSTLYNNVSTEFRVIANMDEGNFLTNETIEGTSYDNIFPTVPSLAFADHEVNEVSLNWDYALEEDFNYHEITGLLGTSYSTENTFSFNLDINDEHRINSVDSNDNQSSESQSLLSRSLHAGANLISFNVLPEDISVANVFESIEANATGVITEGGAATQIAPGVWVGSLTEISAQKGYWVILSEDDILLLIGTPTARNLLYNLHAGANLISFPYRYSATISNALEDGCESFISGIITEGEAASQIASEMWVGSLTAFKATKGYWVIISEDCALTFENGCDELECAPMTRENQTIPNLVDYEYNQSTKQAFYFFNTIENIKEGDYILSFNGDKLTGLRQWQGSVIDVPVMGYDGNSYSDGYIEAGSVPSFKLLSDGELTLLDGNIPTWSDNGIFMVSNLSQVIIPGEYILSQAYPNPFNPKTALSFAIPVDTEVTLSIYNLQGREVATLIEGNMSSGYHSVVWDASAYSSGVYFARMVSGSYTSNQKLVLLK